MVVEDLNKKSDVNFVLGISAVLEIVSNMSKVEFVGGGGNIGWVVYICVHNGAVSSDGITFGIDDGFGLVFPGVLFDGSNYGFIVWWITWIKW